MNTIQCIVIDNETIEVFRGNSYNWYFVSQISRASLNRLNKMMQVYNTSSNIGTLGLSVTIYNVRKEG